MGESTAEAALAELYRQKAERMKEGKPVDIKDPKVREEIMARQTARLDKMAEVMKERGFGAERGEKRAPVRLDVDLLLPKLERLLAVLADYDIVTQQQLLELACATHAMRMGSSSGVAVSGMFKHINQMLNQR